jgi:hypothetical protein
MLPQSLLALLFISRTPSWFVLQIDMLHGSLQELSMP